HVDRGRGGARAEHLRASSRSEPRIRPAAAELAARQGARRGRRQGLPRGPAVQQARDRAVSLGRLPGNRHQAGVLPGPVGAGGRGDSRRDAEGAAFGRGPCSRALAPRRTSGADSSVKIRARRKAGTRGRAPSSAGRGQAFPDYTRIAPPAPPDPRIPFGNVARCCLGAPQERTMSDSLRPEIEKRRTFAIISHPDAGKTTLTEKILLFGGAIQLAGAVKGRKARRHATSDWMQLEQERGISVTSSVMQFPYGGRIVNLLDTPGHEDFSEDTYRTLTAVDSALMVIDAAKGVEARTIKLMEVCRLRTTPIMSFINKFDRDGREPVELLDEIETVLKIECAPVTWPI